MTGSKPRIAVLLLVAAATIPAHAESRRTPSAPAPWLAHIGGEGAETVFGIAEDRQLCLTGTFISSVTFGTGKHAETLKAETTDDIYVACYEKSGQLAFATRFGARRADGPRGIAALPDGGVVITGLFAHHLGAGGARTLTSDGSADVFLIRLDAQGNEIWARRFGGRRADIGVAVSVDHDGNILLAGSFEETLLYRVGDKTKKLNSIGSLDAFVMKLDAQGEPIWARRFGGPESDEAAAIAAGRDGEVLLAGTFRGEAGTDGLASSLAAQGYADAFVAAFSADGNPRWARKISGDNQERVGGLAVDIDGRIFLAGSFQNVIEMPDQVTYESLGSTDLYVARFAPDGRLQKSASFGGKLTELVQSLAVAPDGTLLLTGYFQGRADFAPGPEIKELSSGGAANTGAFLLELGPNFEFLAAEAIGGEGLTMGFGVVGTRDGQIAVTGLFNDRIDVRVPGTKVLEARGKTDVYVLRRPRL